MPVPFRRYQRCVTIAGMHAHRHRVRYHETDAQGFLFNARYLEIADVAMTEFFRALGHPYQDLAAKGFDPSLVKAELGFARPTHFDDVIDVDVVCTHVGNSSFTLVFTMTRDGETVCSVTVVYVNVDVASETSTPLPDEIATVLRAQLAPGR